jgi:Tfp pilus assembly protein PilO
MNPISSATKSKHLSSPSALLLAFALPGLFFFYFIHPLLGELDAIEQRASNMEERIVRADITKRRLAEFKSLTDKLLRQLAYTLPPRQGNRLDSLGKLQELARLSNLSVSWRTPNGVLEPERGQRSPHIVFQIATVRLVGDYGDLRNFLHGLTELERIVGIRSFEMGAAGKNTTTLQSKLELQIPFPENLNYGDVTDP